MNLDAESYLKSGSNELRILEYRTCGHSFGINILKVQKIVSHPDCLSRIINVHRSIKGIFRDNGIIIPLIDLADFLGYQRSPTEEFNGKIIITEFFAVLNGFWVDTVDWIHHFRWENVIHAHEALRSINQKYVISIVKPDGERMVPLLDYETIILDICPELGAGEMKKINKDNLSGKGRRILIAEDSPSVRNMLLAELSEVGFDVVAASDGKNAVGILEKDPDFDLVISDVEMPQMDGLALTCAIRNDVKLKNLPVIVYPSIGDIGMKTRAQFLKVDAHITKLNVEQLLATVKQLIAPKNVRKMAVKTRKAVSKKRHIKSK
jgi:two-component system chemotaxis response regulator CheV